MDREQGRELIGVLKDLSGKLQTICKHLERNTCVHIWRRMDKPGKKFASKCEKCGEENWA